MKSYHQRKTFCEIFVTFNFVIVFLAAQVKRKIESDIEFSGHRDQVTAACLLGKQWSICVKWWQDSEFFFVSLLFLSSVIKFDKKCANSTQRSQSPNSWGWPLLSKIYSPRWGYLSPGNSIVLGIAATLLFISVTSFCWFWGSFCWNSSTFPTDLFISVTYARPV